MLPILPLFPVFQKDENFSSLSTHIISEELAGFVLRYVALNPIYNFDLENELSQEHIENLVNVIKMILDLC